MLGPVAAQQHQCPLLQGHVSVLVALAVAYAYPNPTLSRSQVLTDIRPLMPMTLPAGGINNASAATAMRTARRTVNDE